MSIMGTRVVRVEDPAFLTRGARYTDDLDLVGALHLTLVRSPTRARPHRVDRRRGGPFGARRRRRASPAPTSTSRPRCCSPGPTRRWCGRSWPPTWCGSSASRSPPSSPRSAYQGQDAADLVEVDYDPLPVVIDLKAAATDEVLLFPEAGTNTSNGFDHDKDFDADLFDGCEVVVTQRDRQPARSPPAPLETRAAAAEWGDDGRVTLWAPPRTPRQRATRSRAGSASTPSRCT